MMPTETLTIKNMVCQRCIVAVQNVLNDLHFTPTEVILGQVTLPEPLETDQRQQLSERLAALGFELLESGKSSIISRIKSLLVEQIHHNPEPLHENFSTFLSENLHLEYSYLSRLFSAVEGITIEKYITRQKIEKVKELLFYDELSLSEIAYKMNYSSVAYLSTQFKKETGMTPTQFKNMHQPGHQHLDTL